jgi:hypothetical protein
VDVIADVLMSFRAVLQARGLTPQLFLSASHLANHQQAVAVARSSSSSSARSRGSIIPAAAREVLEVFVMQKQELLVELQAAQQLQHGSTASSLTSSSSQSDIESNVNDEIQARIEALGLSMAVLTTLVRLLELKLIQMEGEEGTGGRLLFCCIVLYCCVVTLQPSAVKRIAGHVIA